MAYMMNENSKTLDYSGNSESIIQQIENNMVLIPAGEFLMGGNLAFFEQPLHKVFVDAFYINKYEVTFEEYETFCKETGWRLPVDPDFKYERTFNDKMYGAQLPVVMVTRNDAEEFCRWISKKTGRNYRLPTEAEWEKGARGGLENKLYPWGNEEPDDSGIYRANYGPGFGHNEWKKDGYEYTAPVGSYPPNGYGLYDMAGNVWEWVSDWFDDNYYSISPYKNPRGPAEPAVGLDAGARGILRGGCYSSSADHLRCAKRYGLFPKGESSLMGFRIAREQ
jgi:sulfatase modifying factor 1